MSDVKPQGLLALLGNLFKNKTGFQNAHIVGSNFAPAWFRAVLGSVDNPLNFIPLPETTRGGATLGVAVHSGEQVRAFNRLFYDVGAAATTSNKYLNFIERELTADLQTKKLTLVDLATPAGAVIRENYAVKVANFLDFAKILFMNQGSLDTLGFSGLQSLAMNASDWRYATAEAVTNRLNQLNAAGLLDYANVIGNGLFQKIASLRGAAAVDIDASLIAAFPELARLIYPNGNILWSASMRAEIILRQLVSSAYSIGRRDFDYASFQNFLTSADYRAALAITTRWISAIPAPAQSNILSVGSLVQDILAKNPASLVADARAFLPFFRTVLANVTDATTVAALRNYVAILDEVAARDAGTITGGLAGAGKLVGGAFLAVATVAEFYFKNDALRNDPVEQQDFQVNFGIQLGIGIVAGGLAIWGFNALLGSVVTIPPLAVGAALVVGGYVAADNLVDAMLQDFDSYKDSQGNYLYPTWHAVLSTVHGWFHAFDQFVVNIAKEVAHEFAVIGNAFINFISGGISGIVIADPGSFVANPEGEWLVGQDVSTLVGRNDSDKSDVMIATDAASAYGYDGGDILFGWNAITIKKGEALDSAIRNQEAAANSAYQTAYTAWVASGSHGSAPTAPARDPNAARADHDYNLLLDGGDGNDWVIAPGGEKATTAGGLGRDLIYNTSKDGIVWGDVANSILDPGTDTRYYLDTSGPTPRRVDIEDSVKNADNFVWAPGGTIEDPQYYDILTFFGIPLVNPVDNGGVVLSLAGHGLAGSVIGFAQIFTSPINTLYNDAILPFITYSFKKQNDGSYDLIVSDMLTAFLDATDALLGGGKAAGQLSSALQKYLGHMTVKDYIPTKNHGQVPVTYFGVDDLYAASTNRVGKLGIVFKKTNPIAAILSLLPPTAISFALSGGGTMVDEALTAAASVIRFAKALSWYAGADPLVLDLSGQGLTTISVDQSSVHFDLNNDFFSERTGWLVGSDEGFLVLDKNGNGVIDDANEMFGNFVNSGFADLARYDSNKDGAINSSDAIFSQLQVWTDANEDGVSQMEELYRLSDLSIASISLTTTPLNGQTAGGASLRAAAAFTRTDGTTSAIYETIFDTDQTDTIYRGETGLGSWQKDVALDIKGFGLVTHLNAGVANDQGFADLVATTAAAMTTPVLSTLVAQIGPALSGWGETLNLTRELTPTLYAADGATLLDRAVYVEDSQGGYWKLASGAPVRDANGDVLARPDLQQVMNEATAGGAQWRLEQNWSPISRTAPLKFRVDTPYLVQDVGGRAVILNYGVQNADGGWSLANGNPVLDAHGGVISAPTLADILAQIPPSGEQWRVESFGYNPIPNIPVQQIGVDFLDGKVVDYTVQVTDQDGTFYVWARNLDRALAMQAKNGDSRAYNLHNY